MGTLFMPGLYFWKEKPVVMVWHHNRFKLENYFVVFVFPLAKTCGVATIMRSSTAASTRLA